MRARPHGITSSGPSAFSPVTRTYRCRSPYRNINAGHRFAAKARAACAAYLSWGTCPCASRAQPRRRHRRRPPLEVTWRAPPSEPHRHLYNLPWPPYCTPRAPQVSCVPGQATYPSEDRSQRPPGSGAAEPPRRHALGAVQSPESVVGEPPEHAPALSRPSRAFPSPELSSLRQPWSQGPNCNLNFLSRGLVCKIRGPVRKIVSSRSR
jgi:hypothetical protein